MAERNSRRSPLAAAVRQMLRDPSAARHAIVLREVLGPPVGERPERHSR